VLLQDKEARDTSRGYISTVGAGQPWTAAHQAGITRCQRARDSAAALRCVLRVLQLLLRLPQLR
jgi:hypothetical protein